MSKITKAVGIAAISVGAAVFGYQFAKEAQSDTLAGIVAWSAVIGLSTWYGFRGRMEATTADGLVITREPQPYYHAALGVSAGIGSAIGQALYYHA